MAFDQGDVFLLGIALHSADITDGVAERLREVMTRGSNSRRPEAMERLESLLAYVEHHGPGFCNTNPRVDV